MIILISSLFFFMSSPQQPGGNPSVKTKSTDDATSTAKTDTKPTNDGTANKEVITKAAPVNENPNSNTKSENNVITKEVVVEPPAKKKTFSSMFTIGAEAFFGYYYIKKSGDPKAGNMWDADRAQLNLKFAPSDIVSASFTLDKHRSIDGTLGMYLKYGWLEFGNFTPLLGDLKIITGQIYNPWKKYREKAMGIRYFTKTPIEQYGFVPAGDLGIWVKGPMLDKTVEVAFGAGNGIGNKSAENDKGKAFDLMLIYHLLEPIHLDLGAYMRGQMNNNQILQNETTTSILTAVSLDTKYSIFKAGLEYSFYSYNDWDPTDNSVKIRHNFNIASLYFEAEPLKKLLGFAKIDYITHSYGTSASTTPIKHNMQSYKLGAGYNLFPNFWIGAMFTLHQVEWPEITSGAPTFPSSSSDHGYYDAAANNSYWDLHRDGEMVFSIHTRFKY